MSRSEEKLQFSAPYTGAPITIGDGFTALQFREERQSGRVMSPIVLVDHFRMSKPTFDDHPHAGMSAVTLVFEDTRGEMLSRDSAGHSSLFGAGDLHWTLAGRGIVHTQLPVGSAEIHALQIFVNLPATQKSIAADSFKVAASDMPEIKESGLRMRVVAGTLTGFSSPATPPGPILMLDGYLTAPHAPAQIPMPSGWNAWIHVVDGTMSIDGAGMAKAGEALCAQASASTGTLSFTTGSSAHFVVLAGPHIDEPVVQHGPFVFESKASLARAITAFNAGKFGQISARDGNTNLSRGNLA